jgi:hypothetical protein
MIVITFMFLSDGYYRDEFRVAAAQISGFFAGQSKAPDQYRIGVLLVANFLSNHSHGLLATRRILSLIDGVSLGIVLWIGFSILVRHKSYSRLSDEAKVASNALGLALLLHCLSWVFWYHRAETLANAACIAIVSGLLAAGRRWPVAVTATGLLAVSVYMGTIRADSGFALNVGIVLIALFPGKKLLPLGQANQVAIGIAGGLSVVAVEYYISHIMYPHRPYPDSTFLLFANLRALDSNMIDLAAIGPWFFMLAMALRSWERLEAWESAIVIASVVEFVLFIVVANGNEPRMFLPYPMAMMPIFAVLATRYLIGNRDGEEKTASLA